MIDIYVRVSTVGGRDVTGKDGSADVQEQTCRATLEARGLKAGKVHRDLDESGGATSRPKWDEMLARIEDGKADGFVVAYSSREARNMLSGEQVIALGQRGVTIIFSDSPQINWNDPAAVMTYRMRMVFNAYEREAKGKQMADSRDRALHRGVYVGPPPFGYRKGEDGLLVVHREEAERIRAAYACDGSWLDRAEALGCPTSAKSSPRARARSLMHSPLYRGVIGRASDGTEVFHEHLVIVTRATWERVQPRKEKQGTGGGRARGTGKEHALLSGGLLRCDCCGRALVYQATTRTGKDGVVRTWAYYRCSNGGPLCTAKAKVKAEVVERDMLTAARRLFMRHQHTVGKDADPAMIARLEQAEEVARKDARTQLEGMGLGGALLDAAVDEHTLVRDAVAGLAEEKGKQAVTYTTEEVGEMLAASTVAERRQVIATTLGWVSVNAAGDVTQVHTYGAVSAPEVQDGVQAPAWYEALPMAA